MGAEHLVNMTLTKEQTEQIKKQILEQIKSWPDEQRLAAQKQLEAMSEKGLEDFLIKNKMISPSQQSKTQESKCVFCEIIKGNIPSYKLDENKSSIAILEINPLSKAHAIIVPKKHLSPEKLPTQAFTLAKKIAKKIQTKFKPDKVDLSTSEFQGHGIINIIPHYGKELKKYKAEETELTQVRQKLEKKIKEKPVKPKQISAKEEVKKLPKFPIRIP